MTDRNPDRRRPAHRLAAAVAVAVALLAAPSAARAADYTVTGTGDGGSCAGTSCDSLRAAVDAASGDLEIDRIFLSGLSGTITLGSQLPTTLGGIEVRGPGATTLAVSGDNSHRIFNVGGFSNLTISGLTLRDGDGSGGAIQVGASGGLSALTLRDSIVTASGGFGGNGGGIAADGSGSGVQVTIEGSTITGNSGGFGGGVNAFNDATLTIRRSTISGNRAAVGGGGLSAFGVTTTIEGSTITGNQAGSVAPGGGGGIFANSGSSTTLTSTIVAGNTASAEGPDTGGAFRSSFSLIGNTSGASITVLGGSIFNLGAQLGPLADNGGPTPTHAPALTSPAIDAGLAAGPDQRGFPRPVIQPTLPLAPGSNAADIGAVELAAVAVPVAVPSNAFSFGKLKRKTRKGIAILTVHLPGPGEIGLRGKGIKRIGLARAGARASRFVDGSRVKLRIKPKKKGKAGKRLRKRLRKKGKAKRKVRVTFVPTGGTANTQSRKVKLVKKRR